MQKYRTSVSCMKTQVVYPKWLTPAPLENDCSPQSAVPTVGVAGRGVPDGGAPHRPGSPRRDRDHGAGWRRVKALCTLTYNICAHVVCARVRTCGWGVGVCVCARACACTRVHYAHLLGNSL